MGIAPHELLHRALDLDLFARVVGRRKRVMRKHLIGRCKNDDAGDYQQHPAFHETVSFHVGWWLVVGHQPISSGSDTPPLQTCPSSTARFVCRSARHSPAKVWQPSPAPASFPS